MEKSLFLFSLKKRFPKLYPHMKYRTNESGQQMCVILRYPDDNDNTVFIFRNRADSRMVEIFKCPEKYSNDIYNFDYFTGYSMNDPDIDDETEFERAKKQIN